MQFISSKLKRFDFHRKTVAEINDQTLSGAFISIISFLLVAALLYSNFVEYFSTDMINHMTLDHSVGLEDVEVKFEVVLSNVKCDGIHADHSSCFSYVLNFSPFSIPKTTQHLP